MFSSLLRSLGATENLPGSVSMLPLSLSFLLLILSVFVPAKIAALAPFKRMDTMPAFRQIFARIPIAKTPVTLHIPRRASNFRFIFVMYRIWLRYCSFDDWLLLKQSRGDTELWKRLS
jgi:hypothetical protein